MVQVLGFYVFLVYEIISNYKSIPFNYNVM